MKNISYLILLINFATLNATSFGSITGQVIDADTHQPLIGANVIIKGTSIGTATNLDGYFEINTSDNFPIILIISYLGYANKEIIVEGNKRNRTILLLSDNKTLKEVRVIDSRLTEKQKESPLTIEAMDIIAIKE